MKVELLDLVIASIQEKRNCNADRAYLYLLFMGMDCGLIFY